MSQIIREHGRIEILDDTVLIQMKGSAVWTEISHAMLALTLELVSHQNNQGALKPASQTLSSGELSTRSSQRLE